MLIGKHRETLHNLLKQPPLADSGISPIRWGNRWDSDEAVLTTDNDTSRMEASPCTNIRSSSTSDVIATYLNEEKERIKRRLNVIVHNTEESPTDDGQARKDMMLIQLCRFLISTWVLNPLL